ncbi:uncharacterized protein LOC125065785 [Vanessa atalanta]|uniref:uncharacterized protein LOC125065785 n=1 Tax=Vanessa atalanta TaxID=42275 RepID=UPI001FCCD855|nr:uncharacterized protein LOC125065785 [Vanessa atalanta]
MDTAIALIFGFLVLPGPSCTNSDNLALLAGTLKTTQRAACDDEMVSLSCPPGTSINIQVAQYGKAAPGGHGCVAIDSKADDLAEEEKCLWPNTMQYSLLQTVVEACQKKPQCKFSTKSKPGLVDPCPRARKFVEVAYKCRPSEFRSRTGCEDEVVKLSCNAHSRVAIFNAEFGRAPYETMNCPQYTDYIAEKCFAPYAVKTVMQICHGKRWCQIVANNRTFGSPCKPNSRNYLKIVYACVPLGVLTEKYESPIEEDEVVNNYNASRNAGLFDESDIGENWREPNIPISNPALQSPIDVNVPSSRNTEDTSIRIIVSNMDNEKESSLIKESSHYSSNTKFLIYISIGILIIIILVALLFGIRYYKNRERSRNSKNGDMFTTEAPNVFNDAASDIDDVDVSHISGTFYDPLHPDMILYRDGQTKTALRAMKPLSTVYPCAGASMYGNVDYAPSNSRETRFMTKEMDSDIKLNPNFGWIY